MTGHHIEVTQVNKTITDNTQMDKYTKGLRDNYTRTVTQLVNINNVTNDLDKKRIQDNWTNKTHSTGDNTRQYVTIEGQVNINNNSFVNTMLL